MKITYGIIASITAPDFIQTLTYSGERLVRADDAAAECAYSGATDFEDGASASTEYTYDAAGNMLTDANRGIGSVTYNRLHRAESVTKGNYIFGFVYDSAGNMLRRTQTSPSITSVRPYSLTAEPMAVPPPQPVTWSVDTMDYCGPFEYRNGTLTRVDFPGGFVRDDSVYHYIHDHQGNVRQVVNAATGYVAQENHYYPGGMLFGESSAFYFTRSSSVNAYRYGGKEFLTHGGLHLSLHGARMYDPALLRFITPDPLRHETPHLSPYLYCAGNPVMFTDPSGMEITQEIDGNLYMYKKSNNQWGFYDGKGNLYTGDKSFAGDLDKIRNADPILEKMITIIVESDLIVRMVPTNGSNKSAPLKDETGNVYFNYIFYNPQKHTGGKAFDKNGKITKKRSPEAGLTHELGHVFDRINPVLYIVKLFHGNLLNHDKKKYRREVISCIVENIYREAIGEPLRTSYIYNTQKTLPDTESTEINYTSFDKFMLEILMSDFVQQFIGHE